MSQQVGPALQIHPSTDTNLFIRYYWSAEDERLHRTTEARGVEVVAQGVTNEIVFRSEDFSGRVLTNNQNTSVIRIHLAFLHTQGLGNGARGGRSMTSIKWKLG